MCDKKVIVLGSDGMLGKKVVIAAAKNGWEVVPLNKKSCNVNSVIDLARLRNIGATHLINCSGIIPGKGGPVLMSAINAVAPHVIEHSFNGHIVHVSTDCVFSGESREINKVYNIPDPVDVYGCTKRVGELLPNRVTVVRTSFIGVEHGLFSWFVNNKSRVIQGYENAWWTGSTVTAVAEGLINIASKRPGLTQHLSSSVPISKFRLLSAIKDMMCLPIEIEPEHDRYINRSLLPTFELDFVLDRIKELIDEYQCGHTSRPIAFA